MKLIGYWAVGGEKNREPGDIFVSPAVCNSKKISDYYKRMNYTLVPSYIKE